MSCFNHYLAVEILNNSLESIQVRVPYGADQIRRIEEIRPQAQLGYSRSAELDVKVEQDGDETIISISLLPEMVDKGKAMIYLLYRVFDLPGPFWHLSSFRSVFVSGYSGRP